MTNIDALEDDLNEKLTIDENQTNTNKSTVAEWDEEKIFVLYLVIFFPVYIRICRELSFIVFFYIICAQ